MFNEINKQNNVQKQNSLALLGNQNLPNSNIFKQI